MKTKDTYHIHMVLKIKRKIDVGTTCPFTLLPNACHLSGHNQHSAASCHSSKQSLSKNVSFIGVYFYCETFLYAEMLFSRNILDVVSKHKHDIFSHDALGIKHAATGMLNVVLHYLYFFHKKI